MHDRKLRKFIIITIIVPSLHDSVACRENALGTPVRSPSPSSCRPCGSSRAEWFCDPFPHAGFPANAKLVNNPHGPLYQPGSSPPSPSASRRPQVFPIPHRHSITFAPSILRLVGLFVRRAPERAPGRQPCSLLGFAELQDELVGVSANRLIEHFGRAGVRRIGEVRTLGVELEARGFDLPAHGRGFDAMQGLGYICGSTQSGGMIEDYICATGLQRTVDGLVERGGVDRPHELVV